MLLFCQGLPRCARNVPASKPINTSLLLYKIVHPPMPTARTLKPALTARHHLEQHDPRPSCLQCSTNNPDLWLIIALESPHDQICGTPGSLTMTKKRMYIYIQSSFRSCFNSSSQRRTKAVATSPKGEGDSVRHVIVSSGWQGKVPLAQAGRDQGEGLRHATTEPATSKQKKGDVVSPPQL